MPEGPKTRPAEWGTAAAGIAVLIVSIIGVDDPAVLTALIAVIAFLPAAITSAVVWWREQKDTPTKTAV